MCVRVLFSQSYLIQRLDHFSEELACTCDGSFWCGVEGTTSSRGGGCLLSFFFLPHPFNIYFSLCPKKKKKAIKIKQPLSKGRGGRSGGGAARLSHHPDSAFALREPAGWGGQEGAARTPPAPAMPGRRPGPRRSRRAEATLGDQLQS